MTERKEAVGTPELTAGHMKLFGEWLACDEGTGFHFKALERRTGLPREKIRSLVHDLAGHGYLEFLRGCFTEDGDPYGSAYVLTYEGYNALRPLSGEGKQEAGND